jgi:hypothetical protein
VIKQVTSDPKGILHDALNSAEMTRIHCIPSTVFFMMEQNTAGSGDSNPFFCDVVKNGRTQYAVNTE